MSDYIELSGVFIDVGADDDGKPTVDLCVRRHLVCADAIVSIQETGFPDRCDVVIDKYPEPLRVIADYDGLKAELTGKDIPRLGFTR